jgi:hypothetical protein
MAGFAEGNQFKQEFLADMFVCEVMYFRCWFLSATFADAACPFENKDSALRPSVRLQVFVIVSEEGVPGEFRFDQFRRFGPALLPRLSELIVKGWRLDSATCFQRPRLCQRLIARFATSEALLDILNLPALDNSAPEGSICVVAGEVFAVLAPRGDLLVAVLIHGFCGLAFEISERGVRPKYTYFVAAVAM